VAWDIHSAFLGVSLQVRPEAVKQGRSVEALALAHFVKRIDFETVARFAAVTAVCEDGKSEADLIWLALAELRGALAEAASDRRNG
jgi:hypothetical protein